MSVCTRWVYIELAAVPSYFATWGLNDIGPWCVGCCHCSSSGVISISGDPNVCVVWNFRQLSSLVATVVVCFCFLLKHSLVYLNSAKYDHWGVRLSAVWGRVERMFLPIRSSAGDLPHQGSGVALYDNRAMKGSSAFFRNRLTVCKLP